MATATISESDIRVRDAVMRQLEWDPTVDASAVGVTAKGGAVTLTGYVDSYRGKLRQLAAARSGGRSRGARAGHRPRRQPDCRGTPGAGRRIVLIGAVRCGDRAARLTCRRSSILHTLGIRLPSSQQRSAQ